MPGGRLEDGAGPRVEHPADGAEAAGKGLSALAFSKLRPDLAARHPWPQRDKGLPGALYHVLGGRNSAGAPVTFQGAGTSAVPEIRAAGLRGVQGADASDEASGMAPFDLQVSPH